MRGMRCSAVGGVLAVAAGASISPPGRRLGGKRPPIPAKDGGMWVWVDHSHSGGWNGDGWKGDSSEGDSWKGDDWAADDWEGDSHKDDDWNGDSHGEDDWSGDDYYYYGGGAVVDPPKPVLIVDEPVYVKPGE